MALSFSTDTATIVHVGLYYRAEVINGMRAVFRRHSVRLPLATWISHLSLANL